MNIRIRWFAALVSALLAATSILSLTAAPVAAIPATPCAAGTYSSNGFEPCTAIPAEFDTAGCWTLTVPTGTDSLDVDAIGAGGSDNGGLGDGESAHALGLSDGDQLRVCVDQGGGTGGTTTSGYSSAGGNGGGASGISVGSDFSHPFVVAGAGGGGGGGYFGGDAGLPNAQVGVNGGGGGSNTSSVGGTGGPAFYPGTNKGADGTGFDANGPGHGGDGGAAQDLDQARGGGGAGGAGYYGGGGGGNGDAFAGGGGGGGGGTSYCGSDNVSLTVSDCTRTAHAGTDTNAGSGTGQAKVTLTFHSPVTCAAGKYSANGLDSPVGCQPIPAAITVAGCWTLTVPTGKSSVEADAIGAAGAVGYERQGGLGDEVAATAVGLSNGDQLRVCVDQGGGGADGSFYFEGGGASGVSFGTDFSHPFVIAGGGGASSVGQGGNAGMPTGQAGSGNGPGTGGDNTAHQGGTGGVSTGYTNGGDGQAFTAAGPGVGGHGGDGSTGRGDWHGGAGGGGYYGGGGAGGGDYDYESGGGVTPGGGGGGTSYCGADNVTLAVTNCARTGGAGTSHDAGTGAGQAKVALTFGNLAAPPTASVDSPAGGGVYAQNQVVSTTFSCTESTDGPGIDTCEDSNGETDGTGALDTSSLGAQTYTVTATSLDTLTGSDHIDYSVASYCTIGSYSGNGFDYPDDCTLADVGHYVDTQGATNQTPCAKGYYQDQAGRSSCTPADIGYYVDSTGSATETACPSGETTNATASTSASDCFSTAPTPYQTKQAAEALLQSLLPTGSSRADGRLNRAIRKIDSSLLTWHWNGQDELVAQYGYGVFNAEKHAVTWLTAPVFSANSTVHDAIEDLVAADRALVVNSIDASSDSAAMAKANARLAKADVLASGGHNGKAIYMLWRAWRAVS